MDFLAKASEIFSNNVLEFQKACQLYKLMLDKNFGKRFCIDGDCKTVFMVEVRQDGSKWGATPKIFYAKEEAEQEAEVLKLKYPFLSGCRVITRRMEEKEKKVNQ